MKNPNPIHVIFGSGPLGLSVMRALLRRSQPVRLVNRRGKADVPAGVEVLAADAYNLESARQACQGAAVVYQCAQPAYHQWVEQFPPLQASILEAAASAGARLVIAENLYMYGAVAGPIHEGLPYNAHTRKGKTRAHMAEAALAAHQAGKAQVAIGRGSDFFGPGVLASSLGDRVFAPALHGKTASAVGSLDLPHTYTYIDDFGEALAVLGERPEALGQAWHVPNPETLTQRQLITLIFDDLGLPPKMSGMGSLMMRLGGLFVPAARESVEMMYEFEKPFIVDDSRYRRTFGGSATPLRHAIRHTVDWYRQHHSA
ncbi:MAG: NAD-dependent epimerase/dehydratase family protein [Chloroflexota bacterium]